MKERNSSVAALVVNYNTTDDLIACVNALVTSGVSSIDVLDNRSTDPEAITTLRGLESDRSAFGGVTFRAHFSDHNLGFGGGINRLAETVGDADYLWIVNPDVIATPDSARDLVHDMSTAGYDLASPVIETGTGDAREVWFAGGTLHLEKGLSEHLLELPVATIEPATFLTGAALCISADAWTALGGFREEFFLYWEDADLVYRAERLGYRAGVVTGVTVWHKVGASGDDDGKSEAYFYYMNRNRLILCGAGGKRLNVLLLSGSRLTIRLLATSLRERQGRWRKFRRSLRGIVDGLRYREVVGS